MLLPRKHLLFRTRSKNVKTSLIFLSVVKVYFVEYTLHDLQLTGSWQVMLPALTSSLALLGHGRLLVGCIMHVRTMAPLTILFTAANHGFLSRFGKDLCRLSSDQPILEVSDSKWGLVLTIISKMLLFGFPDRYEVRFKSFWADQLVDPSRWHEHALEAVDDLKQTMSSVSRITALLGHPY